MSITLKQTSTELAVSGTTGNVTLGSPVTAGSLLVALMLTETSTVHSFTVSDNKSNTWTSVAVFQTDTTDSICASLGYAANVAAGSTTVTVAAAATATYRAIILEFAGVATTTPLIGTNSAHDNAPITSHNLAATGITSTGEALYIGCTIQSASATFTAGSGYTPISWLETVIFAEWQDFSVAQTLQKGPYTTNVATDAASVLAAFKGGAAPPPVALCPWFMFFDN